MKLKKKVITTYNATSAKNLPHSQISGLGRREFERIVKNTREPFNCQFFKEDNNIKQEVNTIKTELKKLNKLEKHFKDVAENKRKINEIDKENKKLKTEIKTSNSFWFAIFHFFHHLFTVFSKCFLYIS